MNLDNLSISIYDEDLNNLPDMIEELNLYISYTHKIQLSLKKIKFLINYPYEDDFEIYYVKYI